MYAVLVFIYFVRFFRSADFRILGRRDQRKSYYIYIKCACQFNQIHSVYQTQWLVHCIGVVFVVLKTRQQLLPPLNVRWEGCHDVTLVTFRLATVMGTSRPSWIAWSGFSHVDGTWLLDHHHPTVTPMVKITHSSDRRSSIHTLRVLWLGITSHLIYYSNGSTPYCPSDRIERDVS